MKAELHQSHRGGHPLFWRRWPRPEGRPVLALHCSLSHGGEWTGLAIGRPDLTVTAPDLVGHGKMPEWDGQSDIHGDSTAVAAELAQRIGEGRPVDVIGHSFGGTVALRLALERPDLIRKLVLIEPVIFAAARDNRAIWPEFAAEHDAIEALHAAGDRPGTLAAFLEVWGSGDPIGALLPQLQAYMEARIGLVMALDAVLMHDRVGLLAPGRLEMLERPVLLLQGSESPAVVSGVHAELARRLPRARRATVEGARHMLPVTHAPATAKLIGDFLA